MKFSSSLVFSYKFFRNQNNSLSLITIIIYIYIWRMAGISSQILLVSLLLKKLRCNSDSLFNVPWINIFTFYITSQGSTNWEGFFFSQGLFDTIKLIMCQINHLTFWSLKNKNKKLLDIQGMLGLFTFLQIVK